MEETRVLCGPQPPCQAALPRVLSQLEGDICHSLCTVVPGVESGNTAGLPNLVWAAAWDIVGGLA